MNTFPCIKIVANIDPCSGSGHILAYMFDVLVQIYEAHGYTTRDAVRSIVENNLYGLDIDERAAQLANFVVMMKARQYDRRFFSRGIQPHVYSIQESNNLDNYVIEYFCDARSELEKNMKILLDEMYDAKEYGSILNVSQVDFDVLYARIDELKKDISIYREAALMQLVPFIQCAEAMSQKYSTVITNPPYMGSKGMPTKLVEFIKSNYPESKADLYGAFIQKSLSYVHRNGFVGLITPYVWMYLSSFEKLRKQMLAQACISSLIQLEYNAFEVACVPVCTYILNKCQIDCKGRYIQLANFKGWENQEPRVLDAIKDFTLDYCFEAHQSNYPIIEGTPIAYWLSDNVYRVFNQADKVINYGVPKQGLITGDNNTYMRLWFEVDTDTIDFNCAESGESTKRWFPHSKGGSLRRWYGNNDYIVNWENGGLELKNFKDSKGKLRSRPQNESSYFHTGITWSDLTVSWFSARYVPQGFIFDGCGPTLFPYDSDNLLYICGYFNSWVFQEFLNITCQGMHYSNGVIAQLPIIIDSSRKDEIVALVRECIDISKRDWDERETSWNFKKNVLCTGEWKYISDAIQAYKERKNRDVELLRKNEKIINDIFAQIFDMTSVIPSKGISDPTITVLNDEELVKDFISYAVGCMFGRYSLDVQGIVFGGSNWNDEYYKTFIPDKDAIIPVTEDEYFSDDIVTRFMKFVSIVFGEDTLEENLAYISTILGGKGNPRGCIRNYFLTEYYSDHCNLYAVAGSGKRPIYWLFDSGKKNGIKALTYMHRYAPDTLARLRTDYIHELQGRYRTIIQDITARTKNASSSEKVKLNKNLIAVQAQAEELHSYEELIHHLADQYIQMDLNNGFKNNYELISTVLAKVK